MAINATPGRPVPDPAVAQRQNLMQLCAAATEAELLKAVGAFAAAREAVDVRRAETGLVMLRGRIGGDGAPFNAGEASVTRAVVRLAGGEIGYAYLLGRSAERARLAAIIDALGQTGDGLQRLEDLFIRPVTARIAAEKSERRAETAETRVDFFTLVRGEDT